MKTALFRVVVLMGFACLSLSPSVYAQYLYYADGSRYPLTVSTEYVTVQFKPGVSVTQKQNLLSALSVIDQAKHVSVSTERFSTLPLRPNVDLADLTQRLEASSVVEAVIPVYNGAGANNAIMTNRFVARFKSSAAQTAIEQLCDRHGIQILKQKSMRFTFEVTPPQNALDAANMFFDSLACEFSVPDFLIQGQFFGDPPTDTYFSKQYYLHNTGQEPITGEGSGTADADIDALEAWDITKGSSSITIAVIDEGVESHEDLPASRLVTGYDFAGYNQNPNTPPISNPDNDPSSDGNEAHGMACAGIIAASHNGIGIAGIAPNCKIMPIKIGDHKGYFPPISAVADAIEYAWENGADALSCSWGYVKRNNDGSLSEINSNDPLYSAIRSAIDDAILYGRNGKGCVVVFAAGNINRSLGIVAFPSNVPGVVCVGASDKSDQIQYFSPMSPEIDIVAPSGDLAYGIFDQVDLRGNVYSIDINSQRGWNPGNYNILPQGDYLDYSETTDPKGDAYPPGNYTARFGGTSAATPQVAGVAALILSVYPNLAQSQVVTKLKISADDIGFSSYDQGAGRLNAFKAVSNAGPVFSQTMQDQSVLTGLTLSFTYTASDPEGDNFTFGLQNPPSGATINSSTGYFTFTPASAGTYTIIVSATDVGSHITLDTAIVTALVNDPPAVPQNFQVARYQVGQYRPRLTWTATTESDLAGFFIERKILGED